jgi:hypothetical protein
MLPDPNGGLMCDAERVFVASREKTSHRRLRQEKVRGRSGCEGGCLREARSTSNRRGCEGGCLREARSTSNRPSLLTSPPAPPVVAPR